MSLMAITSPCASVSVHSQYCVASSAIEVVFLHPGKEVSPTGACPHMVHATSPAAASAPPVPSGWGFIFTGFVIARIIKPVTRPVRLGEQVDL